MSRAKRAVVDAASVEGDMALSEIKAARVTALFPNTNLLRARTPLPRVNARADQERTLCTLTIRHIFRNASTPPFREAAGKRICRFEIIFAHEEQFPRETAPVDGSESSESRGLKHSSRCDES
jgi:hypothetical protein